MRGGRLAPLARGEGSSNSQGDADVPENINRFLSSQLEPLEAAPYDDAVRFRSPQLKTTVITEELKPRDSDGSADDEPLMDKRFRKVKGKAPIREVKELEMDNRGGEGNSRGEKRLIDTDGDGGRRTFSEWRGRTRDSTRDGDRGRGIDISEDRESHIDIDRHEDRDWNQDDGYRSARRNVNSYRGVGEGGDESTNSSKDDAQERRINAIKARARERLRNEGRDRQETGIERYSPELSI